MLFVKQVNSILFFHIFFPGRDANVEFLSFVDIVDDVFHLKGFESSFTYLSGAVGYLLVVVDGFLQNLTESFFELILRRQRHDKLRGEELRDELHIYAWEELFFEGVDVDSENPEDFWNSENKLIIILIRDVSYRLFFFGCARLDSFDLHFLEKLSQSLD